VVTVSTGLLNYFQVLGCSGSDIHEIQTLQFEFIVEEEKTGSRVLEIGGKLKQRQGKEVFSRAVTGIWPEIGLPLQDLQTTG
jgi:hypothetical protein